MKSLIVRVFALLVLGGTGMLAGSLQPPVVAASTLLSGASGLLPGRSIAQVDGHALTVYRSSGGTTSWRMASYGGSSWMWSGSPVTVTDGVPDDVYMITTTKAYVVGRSAAGTSVLLWVLARPDTSASWTWGTAKVVATIVSGSPVSVHARRCVSTCSPTENGKTRVFVAYANSSGKHVAFSDDDGSNFQHRQISADPNYETVMADGTDDSLAPRIVYREDGPTGLILVKGKGLDSGGNVSGNDDIVSASPGTIGAPRVAKSGSYPNEGLEVVFPQKSGSLWALRHCTYTGVWPNTCYTAPATIHSNVAVTSGTSTYAVGADRGRVTAFYSPKTGSLANQGAVKALIGGAWSAERGPIATSSSLTALTHAPIAYAGEFVAVVQTTAGSVLQDRLDLPALILNYARSRDVFSTNAASSCLSSTLSTSPFEEAVSWTVQVKNAGGSTVRTVSSGGSSTSALSWAWDGKNDSGTPQPDGSYTARLAATDSYGWQTVAELGVSLDSTLPGLQQPVAVSEPVFSPNGDGVKESSALSASYQEPASHSLAIKNGSGQTVRSFSGSVSSALSQAWDGKNTGGVVQPDGAYSGVLTLTDRACNPATQPAAAVTIDVTAPSISGIAASPPVFSPNQDGYQDQTQVTATVADASPLTFTLKVPDITGGTVVNGSGQPSATWDGRASGAWLEDGAYLARLTVTDAAGNQAAATTTVTVARADHILGLRGAWRLVGPGPLPGGATLLLNPIASNLVAQETDLRLPAPGPDLAFTRSYNSRAAGASGVLGAGWRHTFEESLGEKPDGTVTHTGADGDVRHFLASGGTYTKPPGMAATLTKNPNGSFTLRWPSGDRKEFDATGKFTERVDPNGNRTLLVYSAGKVSAVTDGGSHAYLTFTYDAAGALSSVTDAASRTYSYQVTSGRLTQVTGPVAGDVTTMAYDASSKMTSLTNPLGRTWTIGYDALGAKTITQPSTVGGTWTIAVPGGYPALTRSVAAPASGTSYLTYGPHGSLLTDKDSAGNTTTYTLDANLNPTSTTNPLGKTTTRTYDAQGNLLTDTNPLNQTTAHTYDAAGNLLSTTNPLGHATTHTYDSAGNRLTTVSARGNQSGAAPADYTTTNTYDSAGNLLSVTDPLGHKTTYTYAARGNQITRTTPRGNQPGATPSDYTWTSTFNAAGNRLSETSPLGHTTTWTYDPEGRVLTHVSPRGNAPGASAADFTTTSVYDPTGQLVSTTDPLGGKRTWTYNPLGNTTSEVSPRGNQPGANPTDYRTVHTYDQAGRRTSTTDPLGNTTTNTYNTNGLHITTTDPRGGVTTNAYDTARRHTSRTTPAGRTAWTYDDANRKTREIAPRGFEPGNNINDHDTWTTYDPAGRITSESDELGNTTSYTYDAEGHRLTSVDPRAASGNPSAYTTTYTYDRAGRTATVTVPGRGTTTYTYDPDSNQTSVVDVRGASTTSLYDASGRQIELTTPDGGTWTYSYDENGNRIGTVEPRGNVLGATASDFKTSFQYDRAGRLSATLTPLGNKTTTEYDADGNWITQVDPRGYVAGNTPSDYLWRREYDAFGWMTKVVDPTGRVVEESYQAGRLAARFDSFGKTSYDYDQAGRLKRIQFPSPADLPARGVSLAYDAASNLIEHNEARGLTSYTYDRSNRMATSTGPSGSLNYSLRDAAGNPTTVATASGTYSQFWRADNQLAYRADPSGTTNVIYNVAGQQAGKTDASGLTESASRTYGSFIDQLELKPTPTSAPTATLQADYDATGRLIRISDPTSGLVQSAYQYDRDGRLTAEEYRDASAALVSATYQYDAAGNRTSATGPGGTTAYQYDEAGRQSSSTDPSGALTTFTYDAGGFLSQRVGGGRRDLYEWAAPGRLTGVVRLGSGESVQLEYDEQGRLVGKTAGLTAVRYVYAHDKIVQVTTPLGAPLAHIAYLDAGRPDALTLRPGTSSAVRYVYRYGPRGEVIEVADSIGSTAVQYTYDAWGHTVATSYGPAWDPDLELNPFRFAAATANRIYLNELGIYYLGEKQMYIDPTNANQLAAPPSTDQTPVEPRQIDVNPPGNSSTWRHWVVACHYAKRVRVGGADCGYNDRANGNQNGVPLGEDGIDGAKRVWLDVVQEPAQGVNGPDYSYNVFYEVKSIGDIGSAKPDRNKDYDTLNGALHHYNARAAPYRFGDCDNLHVVKPYTEFGQPQVGAGDFERENIIFSWICPGVHGPRLDETTDPKELWDGIVLYSYDDENRDRSEARLYRSWNRIANVLEKQSGTEGALANAIARRNYYQATSRDTLPPCGTLGSASFRAVPDIPDPCE